MAYRTVLVLIYIATLADLFALAKPALAQTGIKASSHFSPAGRNQ